jgi:uncharacterized protein (DUF1330 family)
MARGYWVSCYRAVHDPAALAEYAKLAGPAIQQHGGRFIARGGTVRTYEGGVDQRTVIVEFDSVDQAIKARESTEYGKAMEALGNAVERDFRIVEGVG